MRTLVLAALLGTVAATPAMAQDAAPFTGPRVEALVGWDHNKVEDAGNKDGVTYGIGAGYDLGAGSVRFGIDAEFTDSNVDKCENNAVLAGDRLCASAKRDLYAGARVGTVIGDSTLLYAKAGYTNARYGVDYRAAALPGAGDFSESRNLDGVRVGAGVERMLGSKAFIKAEYRYSNYEQGFEKHQLLSGVGLRF